MSSAHLEEELSAYLAGELTTAERAKVDAHLSECPQCRKRLDALRELDVMLSQAGSLEPSAGFVRGVMDRIEQDHQVIRFRSRRTLAWVALAAVIAFFVFVIGYREMHTVPEMAKHPQAPPKKVEIAKERPPAGQTQPATQPGSTPQQTPPAPVSPEDAELIANLDIVENMDVIENYDNVENLDVALLGSAGEKTQ